KGTKYRQYISAGKKKTFIVQTNSQVDKQMLPLPSTTNLRYTYDNLVSNLYEAIIQTINTSSEYVFMSAYSIVGLESLQELVDSIKLARQRGVSIKIFCRGMNYRNDHLKRFRHFEKFRM